MNTKEERAGLTAGNATWPAPDRRKIAIRSHAATEMCKVELEYRNKDMEVVSQRECPLGDYTEMLRAGVLRLIMEAEDLAYKATGGKSKAEWDEDVSSAFHCLRHKALDIAGEVGRIPQNLVVEVDLYIPPSPVGSMMGLIGPDEGRDEDIHPVQRSAFKWAESEGDSWQ